MAHLDLAGSLTKLEWAELHVERLKREVARWANFEGNGPVLFKYDLHPAEEEVRVFVDLVRQPWASFGLIFGDAINNYRSALDHLARELVSKGAKPHLRDGIRVQFPIDRTTRKRFFARVVKDDGRLPGVGPTALRKISPFQPYKARAPWHPSAALLRLQDFTNRDKHRELVPLVLTPHGYSIRSPKSLGAVGAQRMMGAGEPFEPGAEVVRIRVRQPWPSPEPNVRVEFDAPSQIFLEGDLPLFNTLEWFDEFVREVLGSFARR